jgi:hypothetical protein
MHGVTEYRLKDVIEYFFRNNTTVAFVAVLWIEDCSSMHVSPQGPKLHSDIFPNPQGQPKVSDQILEVFDTLKFHLPRPESTPVNALSWLQSKHSGTGISFEDGFSMTDGSEIRMSSRYLAQLIAASTGSLSSTPGLNLAEAVQRQIAEGRMIEGVALEKMPDEDDDWIVLRFGPPDPAVSPFRIE